MYLRSVKPGPLLVALITPLIVGAPFDTAQAERRDGVTPVKVSCSPSSVSAGSNVTIAVTLSGSTTTNLQVALSYSAGTQGNPPSGLTVHTGSDSGQFQMAATGSSGTQTTITASCNGNQAQGSFTIQ
jgi:hypothetical protein